MHIMPKFMDYTISPYPIRVVDLKVDKSKLNIKSLTLLNVGHLPGRILHRRNALFHKWAVVYITDGRGTYQVNGGAVQSVGKGSLFFFFPEAVFNYGPEEDGHWNEYYITIEGERIQEWLQTWLTEPDTVRQVGMDEGLLSKIEVLFMLMESGIPANVDRASLMLESILYEFIVRADTKAESSRKQLIINIMDDMINRLYEPMDAASLAARHHISISTLRRIVTEYTGYPLNEYIHRLKTAEAKKILLNTEHSVKEISYALGYKDVFYFSRLFKKHVGVAPQIYRKTV
jgi:AraC-like DNA-binding protein